MDSIIVKMQCNSKKETMQYDKTKPCNTTLEFLIPYDKDSVFYQMSGGTLLTLNTINKEAADMFKLGESYDLVISPSKTE